MRHTTVAAVVFVSLGGCAAPKEVGGDPRAGAFGFPQAQAQVLCDDHDLRLSFWNDAHHLYVQAVVWADGDRALGETAEGRPVGDTSSLILDVDADQNDSPQVDRVYSLNPWPECPGLRYTVVLSGRTTTTLQGDSRGRGAIRSLDAGEGKNVRVDSFVIPLSEIGKKPGEIIRLAYWASSPKPDLTLDSVGFRHDGRYFPYHLPKEAYHSVTFAQRPAALDLRRVPNGQRDTVPMTKPPVKP